MEYRMVGTENLTRALFAHFIRRQEVTKCWRREAGEWVIRDVPFTDDWSEKDYATLFSELRELLSNGGIVIGAFYKNELKGFASVSGILFGGRREYLDLTNLHVSQDMRRHGIGRELFLREMCIRDRRCILPQIPFWKWIQRKLAVWITRFVKPKRLWKRAPSFLFGSAF